MKKFRFSKEKYNYLIDIFLIVFGGVFLLPSGVGLIMRLPVVSFIRGEDIYSYVWVLVAGMIIIGLGLFCILYPKRYKIRFIFGAIPSFTLSCVLYIFYTTSIPSMRMSVEASKLLDFNLSHTSTSFEFYEKFILFLCISFVLVGIAFIVMYIVTYYKNRKSTA